MSTCEAQRADAPTPEVLPEIVEQPVWGIDCYTRRNVLNCLELEFDRKTSLLFVEKWLLPAINACPEGLAHNISNAARILEGLPFEVSSGTGEDGEEPGNAANNSSHETAHESLLLRSLMEKIQSSGPPWLRAAANQLRRARDALGPDFFRVHPKGHGSVVLSPSLKANALVTFYHGELYPSWRWGEKMDAIEITQKRKDLKP
jgi:[histone H3]-lysine4 N-trimethyltransferase ATXR3